MVHNLVFKNLLKYIMLRTGNICFLFNRALGLYS